MAVAWMSSSARVPLLIHVMPWFTADQTSLGWHWTMNRTAKEVRESGRVASHFRPIIGPYDSNDPDVIELQVAWMKLSGFDGVLADWYGTQSHFDYAQIHTRTETLFATAARAGLKIGVVYEDQSVGNAIREKLVLENQRGNMARSVGAFLRANWLAKPEWIRLKGKPAVFVFGPQAFAETEWAAFRAGAGDFQLLTLHKQQPYAQGAYDWPIPSLGLGFQRDFPVRSKDWPIRVPVAFPRFQDFYTEGGQKGYPVIPDDMGQTYTKTLADAIALGGDAIQVATWNDWQEGTQIEPSVELGMRDLIATQNARRQMDPSFAFKPADLDLPLRLYKLRKKGPGRFNPIGEALLRGDVALARKLLEATG